MYFDIYIVIYCDVFWHAAAFDLVCTVDVLILLVLLAWFGENQ